MNPTNVRQSDEFTQGGPTPSGTTSSGIWRVRKLTPVIGLAKTACERGFAALDRLPSWARYTLAGILVVSVVFAPN